MHPVKRLGELYLTRKAAALVCAVGHFEQRRFVLIGRRKQRKPFRADVNVTGRTGAHATAFGPYRSIAVANDLHETLAGFRFDYKLRPRLSVKIEHDGRLAAERAVRLDFHVIAFKLMPSMNAIDGPPYYSSAPAHSKYRYVHER